MEPDVYRDERGNFVKIFHRDTFTKHGKDSFFEESFYSTSKKGVLRGMHFQIPPKHHSKIVYNSHGASLNVILDLRKGSPTYGEHVSVKLSALDHKMIYIPAGFAHGFLALKDGTRTVYLQSTMHSPEHDRGIRADSFGMKWKVKKPIMSKRDASFPKFADFDSPFIFKKEDSKEK